MSKVSANDSWLLGNSDEVFVQHADAYEIRRLIEKFFKQSDYRIEQMPSGEHYIRGVGITDPHSFKIWGAVGAGDAWDYSMQESDPEKLKPKETLIADELFRDKVMDCFRVKGFSMFPVLRPNALIGVDFKDKKLVGSEMYVLNLAHEGLSVKEVWPEGKRTRVHSYRSEIPDFYFEEEEVGDIIVVGRVVWIYQDTDG